LNTPPYISPMTVTHYTSSDPIATYSAPNAPNNFSNTRPSGGNQPRYYPPNSGNFSEKRRWSCGQLGHLQKDCNHLNH